MRAYCWGWCDDYGCSERTKLLDGKQIAIAGSAGRVPENVLQALAIATGIATKLTTFGRSSMEKPPRSARPTQGTPAGNAVAGWGLAGCLAGGNGQSLATPARNP